MSIEVRPLGVKCNIQCQYCYQNPQRDAGNIPNAFDLPKMKAALERAGSHFTIFGGEPLLVPEHVLEELWAFGLERFGTNGIQTNGTLINDRHIALFKKYKVIRRHLGGRPRRSQRRALGRLASSSRGRPRRKRMPRSNGWCARASRQA